ncbi:hypothetical protein MNV49_005058 [Pseudohyphozyma bogoriensis]|nr:hypothetical protein MNV49_005058 [Pseudohyphozyma bogoriensis]
MKKGRGSRKSLAASHDSDEEDPSARTTTCFLDLPNEILVAILKLHRRNRWDAPPQSWFAVNLTCKRLHSLAKPLIWENVYITSNERYSDICSTLVKDPTSAALIRHLRFVVLPTPFENIIFSFPGLAIHDLTVEAADIIPATLTNALKMTNFADMVAFPVGLADELLDGMASSATPHQDSGSIPLRKLTLERFYLFPDDGPCCLLRLLQALSSSRLTTLILQDTLWFLEENDGWVGAEKHDFSIWKGQRTPLSDVSLRAILTFIAVFPNLTHLVLRDLLTEESHEGSWASLSLPDLVFQHPLVASLLQYLQLTTKIVSLRFENFHCYREKADPAIPFEREDILKEVDGEFKLWFVCGRRGRWMQSDQS